MEDYVLVTGASSGIGRAFARAYAAKGRNLVLTARSGDALAVLAGELEERYDIRAEVIPLDLSAEHGARALYEEVRGRGLTVSVLVNNAGFATKGPFTGADYDRQHGEMLLNMAALTELAYFFLGDMLRARGGTVLNVASAASFNPLPYSAVYAASKAYVLSLSESLSYECGGEGVRVLAVCPGATDTHFFNGFPSTAKRLRAPEDVVKTAFRALEKPNRLYCTDGLSCRLQALLHRLAPAGAALWVTGRAGKRAWGGKGGS